MTRKGALFFNPVLQLLKTIRKKTETGKLLIELLSLQMKQHKN